MLTSIRFCAEGEALSRVFREYPHEALKGSLRKPLDQRIRTLLSSKGTHPKGGRSSRCRGRRVVDWLRVRPTSALCEIARRTRSIWEYNNSSIYWGADVTWDWDRV